MIDCTHIIYCKKKINTILHEHFSIRNDIINNTRIIILAQNPDYSSNAHYRLISLLILYGMLILYVINARKKHSCLNYLWQFIHYDNE